VRLPPEPQRTYQVTVVAATIAASARPDVATPWQDFALVLDNAEVPAASPVSVVPIIDRSAAWCILATSISPDQQPAIRGPDGGRRSLAVVSFGFTSVVEYPTGPPLPANHHRQPVRDAAKSKLTPLSSTAAPTWRPESSKGATCSLRVGFSRARAALRRYDTRAATRGIPPRCGHGRHSRIPGRHAIYTCAMGPRRTRRS